MNWDFVFIINSILLGIGLAMDAFSVSMTNGLNEPKMKIIRMNMIAGVYALFQFIMPMIGWFCIHTIVVYFQSFDKFIPWIALILLAYIGGKMLIEGIKTKDEEIESDRKLPFITLIIQGIATSIDALSVGFTIADYKLLSAIMTSLIIAIVTFGICMIGLLIGKKIGTKLNNKAAILGGIILIGIGIEIFVKNIFF